MKFAEVTGHIDAKQKLRKMVDGEKIPHAILISGPEGVGKLRLARALASYIHCKNHTDGDSCGVCPICRQHDSISFPDLHYVYPIVKKGSSTTIASDYTDLWRDFIADNPFTPLRSWSDALESGNTFPSIYVAEAEEIVRIASLSNFSADYKIFIIWLPEKMQTATANKLLKIIEEPFEDTIFIMVSNDPASIIPTILSRTQRIELQKLLEEEISVWLKSLGVSGETAAEAARLSQGAPAKALDIIRNNEEDAANRKLFQLMMRTAYSCNGIEIKNVSETIAALGRQKTRRFFEYTLSQLRENFIYNLSTPDLNLLSREETTFSSRFAPFIHAGNIEILAEAVGNADNDIARNANAKIVCFDLMLRIMTSLRLPR